MVVERSTKFISADFLLLHFTNRETVAFDLIPLLLPNFIIFFFYSFFPFFRKCTNIKHQPLYKITFYRGNNITLYRNWSTIIEGMSSKLERYYVQVDRKVRNWERVIGKRIFVADLSKTMRDERT